MTVPISPKTLGLLLSCGAILPFAAFYAATPNKEGKWKMSNIVSFIIGLITIGVVGFILYQYR